jgi:hypothetical protein
LQRDVSSSSLSLDLSYLFLSLPLLLLFVMWCVMSLCSSLAFCFAFPSVPFHSFSIAFPFLPTFRPIPSLLSCPALFQIALSCRTLLFFSPWTTMRDVALAPPRGNSAHRGSSGRTGARNGYTVERVRRLDWGHKNVSPVLQVQALCSVAISGSATQSPSRRSNDVSGSGTSAAAPTPSRRKVVT